MPGRTTPPSFGRPSFAEGGFIPDQPEGVQLPVTLVPRMNGEVLAELATGIRAAVAQAVADGVAAGVLTGLAEIGVTPDDLHEQDSTATA